MSTKLIALLAATTLIFAGVAGFLFSDLDALGRALDGEREKSRDLESDVARLEGEVARLQQALERAQDELRRRSEIARGSGAAGAQSSGGAPISSEATAAGPSAVTSPHRSTAQTDAQVGDLIARKDLEGIWQLVAELLREGDYEAVLAIAARLEDDRDAMRSFQRLWGHEELIAGRFFRDFTDNLEPFLHFALYLWQQEEQQLPDMAREVRRELDDEMGVILLGYYQGNDPEVLSGFVSHYRDALRDQEVNQVRHGLDMVRALGQISTEESEDLLLELLARSDGPALPTIIQSLTWMRSERAIAPLEEIARTTGDPQLREIAEAALRYLR